jgi:hypothetical protein
MNLAALDRRVGAEGSTDGFANRLGTVDNEQPAGVLAYLFLSTLSKQLVRPTLCLSR